MSSTSVCVGSGGYAEVLAKRPDLIDLLGKEHFFFTHYSCDPTSGLISYCIGNMMVSFFHVEKRAFYLGKNLAIISLTNRNPDSQYHKVSIDINTGRCKLADDLYVERKQLLDVGFHHPLVTQQVIHVSDRTYHYEYNGIDDLLNAARFVYSTLLSSNNPVACKFKINPSSTFKCPASSRSIYLSLKSDRAAQDFISIEQLEAIVTHLNHHKFEYVEGIIINDEFSLAHLPQYIEGESLYNEDVKLVELLKKPCELKRYELRYIDPNIKFGVFSRGGIKEGDILFLYAGTKKILYDEVASYAFVPRLDCLNMFLDAREQGNIARFINHAPHPGKNNNELHRSLLEANVIAVSHYINGINIVVYSANRDIFKGEQLLVDYGTEFFKTMPISRFKSNGKINARNMFKVNSKKRLHDIRIMASDGVEQAQHYLLFRLCVIAVIIALLMGILAYGGKTKEYSNIQGQFGTPLFMVSHQAVRVEPPNL